MATKIKIGISESQKAYTGQVEVTSDELTEEVLHELVMRTVEKTRENVSLLNMKYKAGN